MDESAILGVLTAAQIANISLYLTRFTITVYNFFPNCAVISVAHLSDNIFETKVVMLEIRELVVQ